MSRGIKASRPTATAGGLHPDRRLPEVFGTASDPVTALVGVTIGGQTHLVAPRRANATLYQVPTGPGFRWPLRRPWSWL
jgi:hypothetical protein